MFFPGFFGTRADLLMDVILVAVLAIPFVLLISFRWARTGSHLRHQTAQWAIFVVVFVAVVLFEINIREAGGSGSLIRQSAYSQSVLFKTFLLVHITIAVCTYLAWFLMLLWAGKRRRQRILPGDFSRLHRRVGLGIFWGSVATALTGTAVYVVGFVL